MPRRFGDSEEPELWKSSEDFHGDTFRAVYTVRYKVAIYVLHAFQKKSKTGRETSQRDIELVKRRLCEAEDMAKGMGDEPKDH